MTALSPVSRAGSPAAPAGTDHGARLDAVELQLSTLYATLKHRARTSAAQFDPLLQPAAFRTLLMVLQQGPVKPMLLAAILGHDRSVLSRQLHQLLELGLVERLPDPRDGRGASIVITDVARHRLERVKAEARDSFRHGLASWSDEDLDQLIRLLAKLTDEDDRGFAADGSGGDCAL